MFDFSSKFNKTAFYFSKLLIIITGWFNYVDVVGAHRYYTSEYAKVITQLKENPDAKVSLNLEDKLNG